MAKDRMDIDKKKCVTPEFRVSFPAIFQPKSFEGKDPEYSVVMLFPKETNLGKGGAQKFVSMKEAAFNAAVEEWGPREKWPRNLKMPFRDGAEKSDTEGYGEEIVFVTAKNKKPVYVYDAKIRPLTDSDKFYAGCYARAEVIAFAYDQSGNKGVAFSLQQIQKTRDGEPFGGRPNPTEIFDVIDDGEDDDAGGSGNGADSAAYDDIGF